MCGIVGYVGRKEAEPILVEGLRRLEYRGYDSAGLATVHRPPSARAQARRPHRQSGPTVGEQPAPGCLGISHTRWATHGPATDGNAHPARRRRRRGRRRPQRRHRELRRPQTPAPGRRASSSTATPTPRSSPSSSPTTWTATSSRRCAKALALLKGTYGLAVDQPRQPRPDRRRPPGQPAGPRHRRRRALPGQRPGRPDRHTRRRSSTCRTTRCAC